MCIQLVRTREIVLRRLRARSNWLWSARVPLSIIILALMIGGTSAARTMSVQTIYTVNSTADADDGSCSPGLCTLRDALNAANAHSPFADTINFSVSGTIRLASALPAIADDVTIDGSGHTIAIDGASTYRVLTLNSGIKVKVQALTITKGHSVTFGGGMYIDSGSTLTVTDSIFSNNSAGEGGGIYDNGTLYVANSTFQGNSLTDYGGGSYSYGAGIYVDDAGTLTVVGSTFTGNSHGGGLVSSGTLSVTGSTFSGNSASQYGGGIQNSGRMKVADSTFSSNDSLLYGGGIYNFGIADVTDSTFSNNTAGDGGGIINTGALIVTNSTLSGNSALGGDGGGIHNGGVLTITNGTLSGNSAFFSGDGIENNGTLTLQNSIVTANGSKGNCGGTLAADSHNFADDHTCGGATYTTTAALALGPLKDNGGSTWTMALGLGSAAIDAGDDATCAKTDQRGVMRPQGAHCDAGSYELGEHRLFLPLILKRP